MCPVRSHHGSCHVLQPPSLRLVTGVPVVGIRAERYCHFSITIDTKATIHDTE